MKKLIAVLLAALMALGVSAGALASVPEDPDNLPAVVSGQVAGALTGENDELWYRFIPEKSGFYRFTVTGNGVVCSVYETNGDLVQHYASGQTEQTDFNDDEHYVKGTTYYLCVQGSGNFTIQMKSYTLQEMIKADIQTEWDKLRSDIGIVGILATIAELPLLGIMLGFFFAPFSVGGTLLLSLVSALFLPVTLLLSPFLLIQHIKEQFQH